jgi:hypothetical protein
MMQAINVANTNEIATMGHHLWDSWTAMWNGELSNARHIIADGFYAHLSNTQTADPATMRNAVEVEKWVTRVRNKYASIVYSTQAGPFIDVTAQTVSCYWKANGVYAGLTGKAGDIVGKEFTVVGTDILRFRDGQITECWTMSVPLEINPLS